MANGRDPAARWKANSLPLGDQSGPDSPGQASPAGKARSTRRPRPFGSTVSMLEETNSGSQPCGIGATKNRRAPLLHREGDPTVRPRERGLGPLDPGRRRDAGDASASQARSMVILRMTATVPPGRLLDISGRPQSGAENRSCAGRGTLVR